MNSKLVRNVVLSGIQPSGFIHLGNYLGAVQTWVRLQADPSIHSTFFSIVDYHSITQKYVGLQMDEDLMDRMVVDLGERPEELTLKTAATLIACGIDPEKSTLFVQSHNDVHPEIMWFLSCLTPLSWLNRMVQFKEKRDSSSEKTSLSLYSYPVLQAADILAYRANLVPVGEDQTQHLELAKLLAQRFNKLFGDLFPLPEPIKGRAENLLAYNRVMSLQDASKKMSKSDKKKLSCINLIDDPEMIRLKVQRAKTDMIFSSTTETSNRERFRYNPERPEVANLLRIYAALEGVDYRKVGDLFENDNAFSFKEKLAAKLIDKLCPIGELAQDLCQNREGELLEILDKGAAKAKETSQDTLTQLKESAGILRKNI